MIFGETQSFAIECEFTAQLERWVYGRFGVWVCGLRMGNYSEEVLNLKCTTGVLREGLAEATPSVARFEAQEFLEKTWHVIYGEGGFNEADHLEWRPYLWLAYCQSFETVFSVIAKVGNSVRIAWRPADDAPAIEFYLPIERYSVICAEFISWLDRGISDRIKNIET